MVKMMLSMLLLVLISMLLYTGISYCRIKDGREEYLQLEKDILEIVNEQREKAGLCSLGYDERAEQVARKKTMEMAKYSYFSHTSPVSGSVTQQFHQFGGILLGQNALMVGENLAKTEDYARSDLTADFYVRIWMESESHRKNILNKDYTAMGAAVYWADGASYAAQEFLKDAPESMVKP